MKNKKPTVTIGIPAYNEEKNIGNMLKSVLGQKQKFYRLKKVIVYSDASTDQTAGIVSKLSEKHPVIELRVGKIRKGKAKRLNRLYLMNQSDFMAILDADIILGDTLTIEKAIREFINKPDLLVCSINNLPVEQTSLVGRISNASFLLWQEAAQLYNDGNNVHTNFGSASIIRKEFIKKALMGAYLVNDQGYLYFKAKQISNQSYFFLKNSYIYFQAVNTLKDYLLQGSRAVHSSKEQMKTMFGNFAINEYRIPLHIKLIATFKRFIKDPLYTVLAMLMRVYIQLFPIKDKLYKKGFWDIVHSSKQSISNNQLYKYE